MSRAIVGVVLGAAFVSSAACGLGGAGGETLGATSSALTPSPAVTFLGNSQELCKVSDQDAGADNALACKDDMKGADLGIPVFDGTRTWILFGDSQATNAHAWRGGAESTGYFSGRSWKTGLCGGLKLVDVAGASATTCSASAPIFAPDPVYAPKPLSIADFVFVHSVVQPTGAPALPAGMAIPGTDEVPTGGFFHGGKLYTFYQGAPWVSPNPPNQPIGSVSYLTSWTPSPTVTVPFTAAQSRQIVSKVDFNLDNVTVPPGYTGGMPYPTPTAPPGWPAAPPMGGHFVQVAPVAAGGFLYLFGTGTYRNSNVYLARVPLPGGSSTGFAASLVNTPGFAVWTGSAWSSSVASAGPLAFADDPTGDDVGELSVQYYAQGAWLMMYAPRASAHVVVRWASSPSGPWSDATVVLDMTTSANESLYCCQGTPATGTDSNGDPLWGCDGAQILECGRTPDAGAVGPTRTGPYAPYMMPLLTADGGNKYTVSYMLSSFEPYGTELMSFDVDIVPPAVTPPVALANVVGESFGLATDGTGVYWTDQAGNNFGGTVSAVPTGGGSTLTLASSVTVPVELATDGTDAYWTTGSDPGGMAIFGAPVGGGPVKTIVTYDNSDFAVSLAVDATNLYWGGLNGGAFQAPKATGAPVTTILPTTDAPLAVAVDASHAYFTLSGGSIVKTPIGGGAVTTIASGLDFSGYGGAAPYGLVTDGTSVYWVESSTSGTGRVATASVSATGGVGTTLATTTASYAVALAIDGGNVYWVNASGPGVMSVPQAGGDVTTLTTLPGGSTIAVDATSVYWTVSGDRSLPASGSVYKVAK